MCYFSQNLVFLNLKLTFLFHTIRTKKIIQKLLKYKAMLLLQNLAFLALCLGIVLLFMCVSKKFSSEKKDTIVHIISYFLIWASCVTITLTNFYSFDIVNTFLLVILSFTYPSLCEILVDSLVKVFSETTSLSEIKTPTQKD